MNFTLYAEAGSDASTSTAVPDNLQHLKIVIRLIKPLVNLAYALNDGQSL
jgi:hypothetical protein